MLHEPDDTRIHQVAKGLVMLIGCDGAVTQLTRLYGRDRAVEVMRRAVLADRDPPRAEGVETVIDLTDVEPATGQSGRTYWL